MDRPRERQRLDTGYLAHPRTPHVANRDALVRTVFVPRHLDHHPRPGVAPGKNTDLPDHGHGIRIPVDILAVHRQQLALDPVEGRIANLRRRAGLHLHVDLDEVALDLGHHDLPHDSARYHAARHDQHRDKDRHRDAAIVNRRQQQRTVVVVDQLMQAVLHAALNLEEETRHSLQQADPALRIEKVILVDVRDPRVNEVRRQDQLGLDQREQQAKYDDHRDRLEERPEYAADEQHGCKRRHRRQHAEGCRHRDPLCAVDYVVERMAVGSYLCIDALTDNDRVVDDDTEHDYEAEQTDHVDGYGPGIDRHQPQRTEKGNWDTDDDPACHLHTQEQRQHNEHKQRAEQHIVQHHVQAILQVISAIRPYVHLDAFGHLF